MKQLLLSSAIVVAFGFALVSQSAPASAQPTPQGTPAPSFTGAYIGLNLGAAENIDKGSYSCYFLNVKYGFGCVGPVFGNIHAIGFIGGGTLGYNWQIDRLVIGVEGDYDGSSLDGNVSYHGSLPFGGGIPAVGNFAACEGLSWFSTERLRLGFVTSPGSMIYLTGGAAQGEWQLQSNIFGANVAGGGYPDATQATRTGWAEGIGYETALASRITFKVDVLSYELQPFETNVASSAGYLGYTAGKDFYFHGATARLGLNWKL